jgi:hypothetical protein
LPFLATIALLLLRCWASSEQTDAKPSDASKRRRLATVATSALFVTLAYDAWVSQGALGRMLTTQLTASARHSELRAIAGSGGGPFAMGYADSEGGRHEATLLRPALLGPKDFILIDAAALMDMQKAGLEIPPATYELLRSCRINRVVLPSGGAPFTAKSVYGGDLFPKAWRDAFAASYGLESSGEHYAVYLCKGAT